MPPTGRPPNATLRAKFTQATSTCFGTSVRTDTIVTYVMFLIYPSIYLVRTHAGFDAILLYHCTSDWAEPAPSN